MAALNDFISKQPIDVINKTNIVTNKILFPTEIDIEDFYNSFETNIKSINLSDEKALFIASKYRVKKTPTAF